MRHLLPEPSKNTPPRFQTGNVLIISAAHLIHDAYQAFLAPLLPLLIQQLGLSMMMAGSLDVIRKVPSLANPLVGLIADKRGIRIFLALGPAITTIAMSLLGLAPGYAFLAVLALMAGVGSSLFHVPAPVMIKRISAGNLGKGMSFYMLGGELARTVGPLAILGAVQLWGLHSTWRMIPFGLVASVVLYIRFRRISFAPEAGRMQESVRHSLHSFLPVLITLSGLLFFRSALKAAMTIYLPTYLTTAGSTLWAAGVALSILQFAGAGGTALAGFVSDRIGHRGSLIIITVLNPLMMLLFLHVSGVWTLPVLAISGFFLFASGPVLLAVVHQNSGNNASFINGLYMTMSFAISSSMVLLVGAIADKFGLELTFRFTAYLAFGSIPFAFMIQPNKKRSI